MEIYNSLRLTNSFNFQAIRSIEGDLVTYTAAVSFKQLSECFVLVPFNPDSQLLIQRETHAKRIKDISDYILSGDYCLPVLGAISEHINAAQVSGSFYNIEIPANAFRYLFDGQGRLGAIQNIVKAKTDFHTHEVIVKFVQSRGIALDNQLFADWNGSQIKPNASICKTMDSRQIINQFTKRLILEVPELNGRINFTTASVTSNSKTNTIWTLNQLVSFVQISLNITARSAEEALNTEDKQIYWIKFFIKFFNQLKTNNSQLKMALEQNSDATAVRAKTIIGTSVFLKSLAYTARVVAIYLQTTTKGKADWSFMKELVALNFNKSEPEWIGRCMNYRFKFEDKTFNHQAVSSFILNSLGVPVPEELETIEEEVLMARALELKAKREEAKKESNMEQLI